MGAGSRVTPKRPRYYVRKRFDRFRWRLLQLFQKEHNGRRILFHYIPEVNGSLGVFEIRIYDNVDLEYVLDTHIGYFGQWIVSIEYGARPFHNINCLYKSLSLVIDKGAIGITPEQLKTNIEQIMLWRMEFLKTLHQI